MMWRIRWLWWFAKKRYYTAVFHEALTMSRKHQNCTRSRLIDHINKEPTP